MPKLGYKTRNKYEVDRDKDTPVGSLKRKALCKGKKPHDFHLHIPKSYGIDLLRPETPEMIEEYYISMEYLDRVNRSQEGMLSRFGIKVRTYNPSVRYFYVCSVCGKQDYRDKKMI